MKKLLKKWNKAMIKVLKLVSDEEFIGEVSDGFGGVNINKPFKILLTPEGIALIPALLLAKNADTTITIKNELIMYQYEPNDSLYNGYKNQIGGIIKPEKSPLKLVTD